MEHILQICLFGYAAPVIFWNILWLCEGLDSFKEMYNFRLDWLLSVAVWVYSITGLIALIIAINL